MSTSFSVSGQTVVMTTEMHSAGEPLRIVDVHGDVAGCQLKINGPSLLDKRRYVSQHMDALRKFLIWEPRGHHDMYGALLVEPDHPGTITQLLSGQCLPYVYYRVCCSTAFDKWFKVIPSHVLVSRKRGRRILQ